MTYRFFHVVSPTAHTREIKEHKTRKTALDGPKGLGCDITDLLLVQSSLPAEFIMSSRAEQSFLSH